MTLVEAVAAAESAAAGAARDGAPASAWADALAAWDRVVAGLDAVSLPPETLALLLNAAAGAWLRAAWLADLTHCLDGAVALYRRAAQIAPPGSADRVAYFNNLGVALRSLWEHDGSGVHLDEAIAAHEAALDAAGGAGTPDGVRSAVQLGKTLRARFGLHRRAPDADAAVATLSLAVDGLSVLSAVEQADAHEALGNALHDRFDVYRSPQEQDAAVEHLRTAAELVADDDPDAQAYASNLASALADRFDARGDRADLAQSIALLEAAVARAEGPDGDGGPSHELLANLGNALSARSALAGSAEDADRAVAYLARAVQLGKDDKRRPGLLNSLAAALLDSFDLTGQLADLSRAVDALDEAVALTRAGAPDRPARLSNLGSALRVRHLRRRAGPGDLDRAVAAYGEALAATPEGAPDQATYRANLGNALHQRFDVTQDAADLERAVRELDAALASAPKWSPDRPLYLNNLSATVAARAARSGSEDHLDRALALSREALELYPDTSAQRVGALVNLGNAASERFARLGVAEDEVTAVGAYREAGDDGLLANPGDALTAARNWSEWAVSRRAWREVVEAHAFGERAALRLFQTQLLRAHKESWLRDAEGIIPVGAYARAATGDPRGAVVALERGRALLLSERLEQGRADLRRLPAGSEELRVQFGNAAARVHRLEGAAEPAGAR